MNILDDYGKYKAKILKKLLKNDMQYCFEQALEEALGKIYSVKEKKRGGEREWEREKVLIDF